MKFEIINYDIFQKYDFDVFKTSRILEDTNCSLLLYDQNFSSDLIKRNIYYKKITDFCFQRVELVADFSKDFDFFIQTQQFEVLHPGFGFVEMERSTQNFVYDKKNLDDEDVSVSFSDLRLAIQHCTKVGTLISTTQQGVFRMGGEHGLDFVFSQDGEQVVISYGRVYLDDAIKKLQSLKKQK